MFIQFKVSYWSLLKQWLFSNRIATSWIAVYNFTGNGQVNRYNYIIQKFVLSHIIKTQKYTCWDMEDSSLWCTPLNRISLVYCTQHLADNQLSDLHQDDIFLDCEVALIWFTRKWIFIKLNMRDSLMWYLPNLSAWMGWDTRCISKWNSIGFNSEFSSSRLVAIPRLKNPDCLTIYL